MRFRLLTEFAILCIICGTLIVPLAAGDKNYTPVSLNQGDTQFRQNTIDKIRPNAAQFAQYSFCGACTKHEDCGTGNQCCTGDCSGGQKKCYQVATCGGR